MKNEFGEIEINQKIDGEERKTFSLLLDRIYKSGIKGTPLQKDIVSKIFRVRNQGGIRFPAPEVVGGKRSYQYCVLCSTGREMYWKDESDEHFGAYVYFGDQNRPGCDILDTSLKGNRFLADVFNYAAGSDSERRMVPPVFAFQKVGSGSDVVFKGLLVPGIDTMPPEDWLVAFYTKLHRRSASFLNFKSYFTILDTSDGCPAEPNQSGISFQWLTDIENGKTLESVYCPKAFKRYVLLGQRKAIKPFVHTEPYPDKSQQLPNSEEGMAMLDYLQKHFISIDGGFSFEHFAVKILQMMYPSIVDRHVTRKYDDGGIDAIGRYQVFKSEQNAICLDFYVQAKCYRTTNSVDTKDTARLISRIKGKDFGIMFTTSYIARQAYNEIIEDKHPIGFVTGGDIIQFLSKRLQIRDKAELAEWLEREFPNNKL